MEACIGAMPLATIAVAGQPATRRLPPGSLAVVSARLATASGPWLGAYPIILGGEGQPTRRLSGEGTP
jgi:hypothetical protein